MKYSLEQIIAAYEKGEKLKYLFFWGHRARKDGQVSSSCFSQWWYADFVVDQINYPTAEHWMMAEKARLFSDAAIEAEIIAAKSPGEAKKLGRKVRNFDPKIWDAKKYEIVKTGNIHKFSQNESLKIFLINTNSRILVEASPVDFIWGIGRAKDHPTIENPTTWRGPNLLGFALMEVRDELS